MALSLSTLAAQMGLLPHEAIALPATLDNAADKAGMTRNALVAECDANEPLRAYLAGVCRTVMAEVAQ